MPKGGNNRLKTHLNSLMQKKKLEKIYGGNYNNKQSRTNLATTLTVSMAKRGDDFVSPRMASQNSVERSILHSAQ